MSGEIKYTYTIIGPSGTYIKFTEAAPNILVDWCDGKPFVRLATYQCQKDDSGSYLEDVNGRRLHVYGMDTGTTDVYLSRFMAVNLKALLGVLVNAIDTGEVSDELAGRLWEHLPEVTP
jgi:hypothetical protein